MGAGATSIFAVSVQGFRLRKALQSLSDELVSTPRCQISSTYLGLVFGRMAPWMWRMAMGFAFAILVLQAEALVMQTAAAAARPDPSDSAAFARWLVGSSLWGVLSTISVHLEGAPFGNVVSFSDGPVLNSSGTPYFYLTELDPTARDVKQDNRCSFTISEVSLGTCGKADVESPICSKITLSGEMMKLDRDDEKKFAASALFSKHPEMPGWPKGHHFQFYKLKISDIFLIDFFGGPKPLTIAEYYATPIYNL